MGANYGTIADSRADVDVTSNRYETGGFSGKNHGSSAQIRRSGATGTVNGYVIVGGFTGTSSNGATIDQSGSSGDVRGANRVGGFEGEIKRDSGCCTHTKGALKDEYAAGVDPRAPADPASYPGLDFEGGTWVIPLKNPLSPGGAAHPVLA